MPTEIKDGCMKWYVYNETSDGYYDMILNHNTTATTPFNSDNGVIAKEANVRLLEDSKNWKTTARLITAGEVAKIADGWYTRNVQVNLYSTTFNPKSYPSGVDLMNYEGPSTYSWLFDYMNPDGMGDICPEHSCEIGDDNFYLAYTCLNCTQTDYKSSIDGYWTSTPAKKYGTESDYNSVFEVNVTGAIYIAASTGSEGYFGIRPVITLPKSMFYDHLTVTYNDEERITTKRNTPCI